jgi:hypothetical protein
VHVLRARTWKVLDSTPASLRPASTALLMATWWP